MVELPDAVGALQADRDPTELADHGQACCRLARTWLECLDAGFHRGRARRAPPAWVARRWSWGTSDRAVHWCEVPAAASLDSGARAAVGRELWSRRSDGIRAVQLIEHHTAHAARAHRDGPRPAWGYGVLAYHEAIGREHGGALEIWDPTDCAWLAAVPGGGAARILSLRVADQQSETLEWGSHRLLPGAWAALASDSEGPAAGAQAPNAASAAPAPTPARSQNP